MNDLHFSNITQEEIKHLSSAFRDNELWQDGDARADEYYTDEDAWIAQALNQY